MLRYRVQSRRPKYSYAAWYPREAFVILRVDSVEECAAYEVEGDPELVETIKHVLPGCGGLGGHLLQERTTAPDLHVAMFCPAMRPHEPELVEGEELVFSDEELASAQGVAGRLRRAFPRTRQGRRGPLVRR